jgi:hypothetical protein
MRIGIMAGLLYLVGMLSGSEAAANSSSSVSSIKKITVHGSSAHETVSTNNTPLLVMGQCHPVANGKFSPLQDADSIVTPNTKAKDFLNFHEHHAIEGTTNTTVLQQPKHGALKKVTEADKGKYFHESASLDPAVSYYIFIPEEGFSGKDSASVLVDFGTVRVEVVYFFQVTKDYGFTECDWTRLCEKGEWKISSTLSSNNAYQMHAVTHAVVLKKFVFNPNRQGEAITFLPGAIVYFDKTTDDKIHVSYGYGGGLNISSTDVWIPRNIVATKHQFLRTNKWNGTKSAAYESVDIGATYTIHQNGSVEFSISENCGIKKFTGHLYRFNNFLWVRREVKNDDLSGQDMFVILPNGELCSPHGFYNNDKCAIGN